MTKRIIDAFSSLDSEFSEAPWQKLTRQWPFNLLSLQMALICTCVMRPYGRSIFLPYTPGKRGSLGSRYFHRISSDKGNVSIAMFIALYDLLGMPMIL